MKKLVLMIIPLGILLSCGGEELEEKKETVIPEPEVLVERDGSTHKEYYPGKKQLKFIGDVDSEERRHGVWRHYSETGLELSTAEYYHGAKNGVTVVKYPNGRLHYTGEYKNNKRAGVWKTYNPDGSMASEEDYGEGMN